MQRMYICMGMGMGMCMGTCACTCTWAFGMGMGMHARALRLGRRTEKIMEDVWLGSLLYRSPPPQPITYAISACMHVHTYMWHACTYAYTYTW